MKKANGSLNTTSSIKRENEIVNKKGYSGIPPTRLLTKTFSFRMMEFMEN